MADAAAAVPAAAAVAPGGRKTGLLVGLTLGGAVLGGLVASLVIAPRIIARGATGAAADSASAHTPAVPEPVPGERRVLELNNIIVNPAGSQGSRFLMTTVAFAVPGEKAFQLLESQEIEVRDRVIAVLENRTMAQLTAPGARDSLKVQIAAVAAALVGPNVPVQVYLPQFVIQ